MFDKTFNCKQSKKLYYFILIKSNQGNFLKKNYSQTKNSGDIVTHRKKYYKVM